MFGLISEGAFGFPMYCPEAVYALQGLFVPKGVFVRILDMNVVPVAIWPRVDMFIVADEDTKPLVITSTPVD